MHRPRPEFRLHDDFSLTPAYVLGYAFNALGRVEATTPVRGNRGAIALLTELLATMVALDLHTGLTAADPLRTEQAALGRRGTPARLGPDSAARIRAGLTGVEKAVREALRARSANAQLNSPPGSHSVRVLLGDAAFARCPDALRADVREACRALDAHLYTASVFHIHRVWDRLPGHASSAADPLGVVIADPRLDPALHCSRSDALTFLGSLRVRLELQSPS